MGRTTQTTRAETTRVATTETRSVEAAARRRPRLARGTIVGWMVVVLLISLTSVVVVVRQSLHLDVTNRANQDIVQEIEEFRTLSADGVDPETSRPFTSSERLLEVYLSRQRLSSGEVLIGYVGTSGRVLERYGPGTPERGEYDLAADRDFLQLAARDSSGTYQTPVGEMRWARTVVDVREGEGAMFIVAVFTEGAREQADETVSTLAVVSFIALLLGGVISWLVAGRILRPVRQVHETAAEITERDLTRRIHVGDDDVSGLASTFNRMLDRLEEAFRAEKRFVDDAGHELRTPITVIRGHLELMDEDPESRRTTMRIVNQELDRMGRIVTDLLALAKADRQDFLRIRDGVDVAALTVELDAKVSALADRRWGIREIAEGTVRLDPQRVTQAVLQLAQNAVQHTGQGDAVTLGSAFVTDPVLGPALAISVEDTGPGVPHVDRTRIFDRFTHGEPPEGKQHGGAGLGLAIVSAIAQAHGGRVDVGGEPGAGAVFTLLIPAEESDRADATPTEETAPIQERP